MQIFDNLASLVRLLDWHVISKNSKSGSRELLMKRELNTKYANNKYSPQLLLVVREMLGYTRTSSERNCGIRDHTRNFSYLDYLVEIL